MLEHMEGIAPLVYFGMICITLIRNSLRYQVGSHLSRQSSVISRAARY